MFTFTRLLESGILMSPADVKMMMMLRIQRLCLVSQVDEREADV